MNKFIINPFRFEGIVTGGDFCKRDKDVKNLLQYMYSGNNVIISMKRRVGKTSLIKEIFENYIDDSRVICGYVDIYSITSVKELYVSLRDEVQSLVSLSFAAGIGIDQIKSAFSEAQVSMTVSDSPSATIDFIGSNYEALIKKLFLSLQSYASENDLRFVFAIDEFQKITSLSEKEMKSIEDNMRAAMQTCKNISFIISGSNQTMLDSMFKEERSLFRQGTHYTLKPISEVDFYKWVSKKFQKKELTIEKEAFSYIYSIANSEAKIVQQVCFELFSSTESLGNIVKEEVCSIIEEIYKDNSEIASKFNSLKLNEQKMLKVISLEKEHGVTVSPLLEEFNINHGSVSNILKSMVEKYTLVKLSTGKYEIVDTELKLWVQVSKKSLCSEYQRD